MAAPLRREATIEDLYDVPEGYNAELVNGEIVLMSPTGYVPGWAGYQITQSLLAYRMRMGMDNGYPVPDGISFIVNGPHHRTLGPDSAFYIGPWPGGKFVNGVPIFAAEVRSESDYGPAADRAVAEKRAEYFAVGTLVVWDVDVLRAGTVTVYRAADPIRPTVYQRDEVAEAEPALPGWRMLIADLFIIGPITPME